VSLMSVLHFRSTSVLLLSQEDNHSTCNISTETSLTQSSVIGIIHCDAGLKCRFRLLQRSFPVIVSFSCIRISPGNVATQLSCSEIFNNHVIANLPQSLQVKEF